jgi:hypothetical protein
MIKRIDEQWQILKRNLVGSFVIYSMTMWLSQHIPRVLFESLVNFRGFKKVEATKRNSLPGFVGKQKRNSTTTLHMFVKLKRKDFLLVMEHCMKINDLSKRITVSAKQ